MISTVQTAKLFIELFLYTTDNRNTEPTIHPYIHHLIIYIYIYIYTAWVLLYMPAKPCLLKYSSWWYLINTTLWHYIECSKLKI
jgi:hypothetical protein